MRTSYITLLSLLGLSLLLMLGGCDRSTSGMPIPDDDDTTGDDDDSSGSSDDDDTTGDDDDDTTGDDDDDTSVGDDDDTSSDTCADDAHEENDTIEQASPLNAGNHASLRICPSEDDFYSIELAAGEEITVDVLFSNDGGDIDARLFDPSGTQLASGASTDDDEQLVALADTAGTYIIVVLLYSESDAVLGNDYSLNISVTTAVGDDDDSTPGDDDDSTPSGSDVDGDGVDDATDNCPTTSNPNQENADGDGEGDACDSCPNSATGDSDGDGVCDNLDACTGNDSTGDSDSDGICDDTDICTGADSTGDSDSDGICDDTDICTGADATGDSDSDGVCDDIDVCTGADSSGDTDSDDVCDDIDNCPNDANPTQDDSDSNGIGDVCDTVTPPGTCTASDTLSCANNSDTGSNGGAGSTTLFEDWNNAACSGFTLTGPEYIYEFTAEDSGTHTVTLSSSSGNLDVVILDGGVTGTCDPNSCIAYGMGSTTSDSETIFNATIGVTYFIVVDGYLNTTASYGITITPPDADGDGIGDSCDTPDPCIADSFEDNDTSGTAASLTDGSYNNLTSCPSDSDWYVVSLLAGDTLDVDASFLHADGDLDLYLEDSAGTILASGISENDNESLGPYTATTAGDYFIEVVLYSDAGGVLGNSYDLDIDVTLAPCVSDSYEANNSQSAAAPISTGSTGNLTACAGDDDWYSIEVWVGDTIDIDAYFVNSEGDINLRLFDPDQNQVDWDGSLANGASVSHVATQSGTYTIRAYLWQDFGQMSGNPYSLGAVVTSGDDDLEPNDSSTNALEIPGYRVDDLRVLSGDDDWYAVDLGVGDTIAINLYFSDAEGDIDLYLYSPGSGGGAGTEEARSWTSDDDESISTYTATSAGLHYIKVNLYNGIDAGSHDGNLYRMETIVARQQSNWGVDDFFEPNDSQSSAVAIDATHYWGLTANGANDSEDWYSIELESGQTFSMDLLFVDNNADLDLNFRSSTSLLTSSATATNNESVSHTVTSTGTYYIKVFVWGFPPSASAATDYEMDITVN